MDSGDAREHYVSVGYVLCVPVSSDMYAKNSRKSKLRQREGPDLGPRYSGSHISRKDLFDRDNDNDDPFGSGASQQNGLRSEGEDEGNKQDDDDIIDPEDVDMDQLPEGEDEDIDSSEAFGEGDEEKFKEYRFRGSQKLGGGPSSGHVPEKEDVSKSVRVEKDDISDEGSDVFDGVSENSDQNDGSVPSVESLEGSTARSDSASDVSSSEDEAKVPDDRAELRRIMAEEQKSVVATISAAAKTEAAKGRAVNHQRGTFSSFLNIRIRLQKALLASNTLPAVTNLSPSSSSINDATVVAAQQAAVSLWNELNTLRTSLNSSQTEESRKRTFSATVSTSPSKLWAEMQSHESIMYPKRRAILQKWSAKTAPVAPVAPRSRFSDALIQQPLISILDNHLSSPNLEKVLEQSRTPRSCAPAPSQATISHAKLHSSTSDIAEALNPIYDDSTLYTLLLRDLVDQKIASANTSSTAVSSTLPLPKNIPKLHRRNVDTKASKGRKMRYTVHEKLQNFMARDDRGTWEERQVTEFFSGLLGRRVKGGLGEDEVDGDKSEDGEELAEEERLRLFAT